MNTAKLRAGLCLACITLLTGWMAAHLRAADAATPKQVGSAWQYQTFEYRMDSVDRGLNELANAGWEIVSASRYVYGPDSQPRAFVTAKVLKEAGRKHEQA